MFLNQYQRSRFHLPVEVLASMKTRLKSGLGMLLVAKAVYGCFLGVNKLLHLTSSGGLATKVSRFRNGTWKAMNPELHDNAMSL